MRHITMDTIVIQQYANEVASWVGRGTQLSIVGVILVPIALFASLSWRGAWYKKRRALETKDFPVLESRTSS